jgi:hypothetical protein
MHRAVIITLLYLIYFNLYNIVFPLKIIQLFILWFKEALLITSSNTNHYNRHPLIYEFSDCKKPEPFTTHKTLECL